MLPDAGQITVVKPPLDARLMELPRDRTCIVEGFKPAHEAWKARGYPCEAEFGGSHATTIICLPRAKKDARALIAQAMAPGAEMVIIDGQKTDGIDSILRDMRKRVEVSAPISKAHGKLFWCMAPDAELFEDWRDGPALTEGGFWTAPGVFSADAIDPASALLVDALPDKLGHEVADLGAGWGFLSAHILTRADVEAVHLVEAEHMALECARRNVTDPRAVFHWADATAWTPGRKVDAVVMNPPFHTSRTADPALGQAFVRAAAAMLKPQGQLWMVANRHLPYEQCLQDSFANCFEIGGDTRFKLFHAARPKRQVRR
ncbi:ribosomal RNA small subunit methyltransferase C, putative [Roseobacter denitrificans OCh 114]|uniref:Ribosomal RNA small subunit methyltransferase C, putative n=1 Tax=Roseobacter denitrificans (strain ATCC 33942 / OCh 114) TaxID=375451 RepID=Q16AR7_ROSDO|nr:ribosomal RNA small subunit methyltransferase C, putative [Roseobacter denitrificans OCh 114]